MFSISKRPTIAEIHELYKTHKATPSQVFQFFLNRSKTIDKEINSVQNYTVTIGEGEAALCDSLLEWCVSGDLESLESREIPQSADDGKSNSTGTQLLATTLIDQHDFANKKALFEQYNSDGGEIDFETRFAFLIEQYPLFGIPYSLKAIIQAEGEVFTASSQLLKGFRSPYSATVYTRVKQAGAILVAITHMDEFAMGSSGENSSYGPTRNPYDTSRVPGGSSSGPVAAVASGQVVFALGTDTGGSIRQPAAFCGVVGLKPTYGAVPRYGVMPMASSFDQVGPITQTVRDNEIVFAVIAGKDEHDQTSIDSGKTIQTIKNHLARTATKTPRSIKTLTTTKHKLRIGIPKEFYAQGLDPQIKNALSELESRLASLGHELVQVSLPLIKHAIPVYYMTMGVEVASNLERFDGVRYRGDHSYNPQEPLYYGFRSSLFGKEPQRRILLGTYASAAGYYDAYYNQASKVKELTRRSFVEVFKQVDVLLTPTSPEFAFKLGSKSTDPMTMYLSDIYTAVVNPVRIPGLVVPIGLFDVQDDTSLSQSTKKTTKKQRAIKSQVDLAVEVLDKEQTETTDKVDTVKLPTGCQILGPELSEATLYQLAEEIEMIVAEKQK